MKDLVYCITALSYTGQEVVRRRNYLIVHSSIYRVLFTVCGSSFQIFDLKSVNAKMSYTYKASSAAKKSV